MPKRPDQPKSLKERLGTISRWRSIQEPLWKGPEEDGATQSIISDYLCCKERARAYLVEGLQPKESFQVALEFGNMWHLAEEDYARTNEIELDRVEEYRCHLIDKFPEEQEKIDYWHGIVELQFPEYVKYWSQHPEVLKREPIYQEEEFEELYKLPSGRWVKLRGKFDAVDRIGRQGIFLQENKSKASFSEWLLDQQLTFDLQTMTYLTALRIRLPKEKISGVRYNVVRRATASGNKGCISQRQDESEEEFHARVLHLLRKDPGYYFIRRTVEIPDHEIQKFKTQCLNPVLDNLVDDYEWWEFCKVEGESVWDYVLRADNFPHHQSRHYRLPYGVWNRILEGGLGDLDKYLTTGSIKGIERVKTFFPELEEEPF